MVGSWCLNEEEAGFFLMLLLVLQILVNLPTWPWFWTGVEDQTITNFSFKLNISILI